MTTLQLFTDDLTDTSNPAPLYYRYAGESGPQPAYVEIDLESGIVNSGTSGVVGGGVPARVWQGIDRRIPVSPCVNGRFLAETLEENRALLQRILDGATVGRRAGGSVVGALSDDAEEAAYDLERELEAVPWVNVFDAAGVEDYLSYCGTPRITADTTDDELQELATTIKEEIDGTDGGDQPCFAALDDVLSAVTTIRDDLAAERDAEEDED